MEKIKDPAMILSIVDAAAIVGLTAYTYNAIKEVKEKQVEQTKTIQTLLTKINRLENDRKGLDNTVNTIDNEVKSLRDDVSSSSTIEQLDELQADLEAIVTTLKDKQIEVKLPSAEIKYYPPVRSPRRQVEPSRRSVSFQDEELSSAQSANRSGRRQVQASQASPRSNQRAPQRQAPPPKQPVNRPQSSRPRQVQPEPDDRQYDDDEDESDALQDYRNSVQNA